MIRMVDELRSKGSWCGETHVQKAVYLLQELFRVPSGFRFVLYKHGPFSFPLRDELTALRAQGLLRLEPQNPPYGPRLMLTDIAPRFEARYAEEIAPYRGAVQWIAEHLANRGAASLEALATAHWVLRHASNAQASEDALVRELRRIKPHLSEDKAREALVEARAMTKEAQAARANR